MKLTQKQACLLVSILQDTLTKNVVDYLNLKHKDRVRLLNEILNQQGTELIEIESKDVPDGR